jgi:CRISPR system Cascade subunit CasD
VRRPAFPLALGRRSCPPAQPLLLKAEQPAVPDPAGPDTDPALWTGSPSAVLRRLPWQGKRVAAQVRMPTVTLPITVDDPSGNDTRYDQPISFDPLCRAYGVRRVRQEWSVELPTGADADLTQAHRHDPFALLGW